ncbi:hypothetical protein HK405_003319, partial [Cladochytrium tenue]
MPVEGINMPAMPPGKPAKKPSKDIFVKIRGMMPFSGSIAAPHAMAGTNAAGADALRRQLEVLAAATGAAGGANDSRRQAFHEQWLMIQQQQQQYGQLEQQQRQPHEFAGVMEDPRARYAPADMSFSVPLSSPAMGHSQPSRGRRPAVSAPAPFHASRQRSLDGLGSRTPELRPLALYPAPPPQPPLHAHSTTGPHHPQAAPSHAAFPVHPWTQNANADAPYALAGGGGGAAAAMLPVPDASVILSPSLALPSTFGSYAAVAGTGPEAYTLAAAPPSIGGDQQQAAWMQAPRPPPSDYLSAPVDFNQVLVRQQMDQRQPPLPAPQQLQLQQQQQQ